MSQGTEIAPFGVRVMNRLHARATVLSHPATGFSSQPEPRTIGRLSRGRQLLAGNYQFAGHLIEAPERDLWDNAAPDLGFERERQGFVWLDDLAAVASPEARAAAQRWVLEWIRRFGAGGGSGWTPDLTARRLIRWINHALFLLNGMSRADAEAFYRALARQTLFLGRRWRAASPGLPRIEALSGLIYAGLALLGLEGRVAAATRALAAECGRSIAPDGGIETRNPEELLEVLSLLIWARRALEDAGRPVPEAISDAIARIAPTLRALRHADGGLARFHGGGRGIPGRLDLALADSGCRDATERDLAMGFARLAAGRSTVLIDAAPPPSGRAAARAHASTLAFELTSGRRPVIVSCGSGVEFAADWRRAGRATVSHSALVLDGLSSARLDPHSADPEILRDGPREVPVEITRGPDGLLFEGGHDGYVMSHGLTHARSLTLEADGRGLRGEDLLVTLDTAAKRRFDRALDATRMDGIPIQIRFHLHPDIEASLDMGGNAVSLRLPSGETWVFRRQGTAELSLAPSVYLERGRLKPRATRQIVLSGRALSEATRLRWEVAKAQGSPVSLRDVALEGEGDVVG